MKFHIWAAATLAALAAFAALYYAEAYRVDESLGALPELRRPLAEIPMQLGPWTGTAKTLSPEIERTLDAKEYISRTYTHAETGETVDVQLNYGHPRSIASHRPGVCFITQGWHQEFVQATTLTIPQRPTTKNHASTTRDHEPGTEDPRLATKDHGPPPSDQGPGAKDQGLRAKDQDLVLPVRFHGYRHPMGHTILVVNYFNLGGAYLDNPDNIQRAAKAHVDRKNFAAQIILYIPVANRPQALQTAQNLLTHLHPETASCLPNTQTQPEPNAR